MQKISIYIPTDSPRGRKWANHFQEQMSILFGGATTTFSRTSWLDKNNQLSTEPIDVVYSYADPGHPAYNLDVNYLTAECRRMKKALNQEAVLMTIEPSAEVFFI